MIPFVDLKGCGLNEDHGPFVLDLKALASVSQVARHYGEMGYALV